MKTFSFQEYPLILQGKQVYRTHEYSFDFLPQNSRALNEFVGKLGTTSLSIGTLQVEIDIESGNLLYAWGYHPNFNWVIVEMPDLEILEGLVTLTSDCKLQQGVSLNMADDHTWETYIDPNIGYVVISRDEEFLTGKNIKINDCCIVELRGHHIYSIALKIDSTGEVAST